VRGHGQKFTNGPRLSSGAFHTINEPCAGLIMELRKHPRMTWRGHPNWPPHWNGPHGPNHPLPHGEVGILTRVEIGPSSALAPHCILIMRWNDQDYVGSLFFGDSEFLSEIVEVLRDHIGSPISEIGDLIFAEKFNR